MYGGCVLLSYLIFFKTLISNPSFCNIDIPCGLQGRYPPFVATIPKIEVYKKITTKSSINARNDFPPLLKKAKEMQRTPAKSSSFL